MRNRPYVMQDQIKNRVGAIMACDLRYPHGRWRGLSKNLLLTFAVTALYSLALAATA